MPLPKSVTIAAKATEVYCEVWSVILQQICKMPPTRSSDLKELTQLLPYLRQLLTCCACAGLLDNAMISLTCGHCYCFECQFKEPLLKIQCRQCRGRTGLVIENQLQLVVKCYRHMCYILGEELRRNPSALGTTVKSEPKAAASPKELIVGNEAAADKDQGVIPSPKESAISSNKKGTIVDPSFDAVAEIVREVEKGKKVSRAILIIKPPSKYLNTKLSVTTKRESVARPVPTANTPAPKKLPASPDKEQVPEKATEQVPEKAKVSGDGNGKTKRHLSIKLEKAVKPPRDKTHRRSIVQRKEKLQQIGNKSKKGVRKPLTLPCKSNHSHVKKRRVGSAIDSKKAESTTNSAITATSEEERVDVGSEPSPALPASPVMSQPLQSCSAYSFEAKVASLPISVHCLDKSCLKITPESVTRLPQEEPGRLLADALSLAPDKNALKKKTSFVEGEWRKDTRKRKWGPLCPSVVVKRPREAIAKMVLMQSKAAKGKRRARHKVQQQILLNVATPRFPPSFHPSAQHFPQSLPPPFRHLPPNDDLPLPDDIPILQNDGNRDLQVASDLKWKELSDFLENNDETTLPPFGHYGMPPHHPPPPHTPSLDPVPFGEYAPRHFHPPYLPLPPRHPHMLPPIPHPGPHTPVMPFTPTLRPDIPPHEGYFSPMIGPEDFLSGGGIGPDRGGYSSPMTPRRNYSSNSMCSEGAYQHSPGHHPGGHFPIPSPGVKYPPPGRPFPGPLSTPPKPKNGPMSKMVGKMKIKSPNQQSKKFLSPGNQGNQAKKQRRSPGYSEVGWRCRCGTNNVMFPKKVCAKGKCPCYTKGIACKNCLCRHCHNPFGGREQGTSSTSPVQNDPDQDLEPDPNQDPEPDLNQDPDPDLDLDLDPDRVLAEDQDIPE